NFHIHDMCEKYCSNSFDYVFNLFTNIGYFETEEEHLIALKVFNDALKPGGIFVLDYFNAVKVLNDLIPLEYKTEEGIEFKITKHIENKKIHKTIEFDTDGQSHKYIEEVFAFSNQDFREMLKMSNFTVIEEFGDYH